jgi:glycosyltransferase involved in cell wall biosynthesis
MPADLASVYVCYWSLRDPLCQSQSLPYLRQLAERGHRTALVTFEQRQYRLPRDERRAMRARLAGEGILWRPLKYHKRVPLVATAWDVLVGTAAATALALRHHAPIVHSRASVPGAIGLVASGLARRRFLYDADSKLSLEYADNRHWKRSSLAFRLMARIEAACRRRADAIVVLSHRLREEFVGEGVRAPIAVVPCCVDVDRFRFDSVARETRRRELGLGSETLFVYVGKSGPRYLVEEMLDFVGVAAERSGGARLLVITHESPENFLALAARRSVPSDLVLVRRAEPGEVPSWLSAGDAGLAFIRPTESERGSSPIKVAEYLAAGLPVVITPAIGDYSEAVEREEVGVLVSACTPDAYQRALGRLVSLVGDVATLRTRCRHYAESRLDARSVGGVRYGEVYRRLLASSPHAAGTAKGREVDGVVR